MNVVVTGHKGFIGHNLMVRLKECRKIKAVGIDSKTTADLRQKALMAAQVVVHLAGVNRPQKLGDFAKVNTGFTQTLCEELKALGRPVPIIFSSSAQAALTNPYGISKFNAEQAIANYGKATGAGFALLRLWNVFGKWAQPNYNSVVATFCHNISRGLPVEVHDAAAKLRLVYIDDVVDSILALIAGNVPVAGEFSVGPVHETTVGELLAIIQACANVRQTREIPKVGDGFTRQVYATYLSYIPSEQFAYRLSTQGDSRGMFAEVLRTAESGQISVFTAHPGKTRGGHYHHTKNEKFLVVQGRARFRFRNLKDGTFFEVIVEAPVPQIVDTVPGWIHDITNIGESQLIVLLWANEAFDPAHPDTIPAQVIP